MVMCASATDRTASSACVSGPVRFGRRVHEHVEDEVCAVAECCRVVGHAFGIVGSAQAMRQGRR